MRTNLLRSERLKEKKERLNDRKERLRSYRKWTLGNILGDLNLRRADGGKRRRHITQACIIAIMAALSIVLYWFCFLDTTVSSELSVFIFLFYLVPISFISVLYGWVGGIICFTPVFVVAIFVSPSYAFFLFFHLIAIYIFSYIKTAGICKSIPRTIIAGLCSGMALSLSYYLIFVLIPGESFSEVTIESLVRHIINIVPQSVVICLLIYWFSNKCAESLKNKLGCESTDSSSFINFMRDGKGHGYRSLSGKIFALFLVEAIFMGIAAAFFTNSLIPKMMEQSRAENFQEGVLPDDKNPPPKPEESGDPGMNGNGFNELFKPGEFTDAFEKARAYDPVNGFAYDDKGIAFDLKLIMMLLCVIHPIVLVSNFIGQKLIAQPITEITDAVSGFGDDVEQRLEIEKRLSSIDIHSEDEIEELYGVVDKMVKELNSYIDEMKRERQLEEDLRVAKAASEAKSTFLSNVSHEIRTPINAVLGLDEMILRESADENIVKYAADIKNSGRTLLALINDLLDFSKIEAGKMEIVPAEYELSSTINDLINMVREKAKDKGLELIVNVASDTPHVLYGDEIRLKQCILNILNNAVKYTHEGSVTLNISGRRKSDDEIWLFAQVKDTGIGIKEEDLARLYSPFERIEESRNRTIEGTGLGMSIVKQLLDMMGTSLKVSSVYGEGSDFSFEVAQRVVKWDPIGDFNETYRNSVSSTAKYKVSFIAPEADILIVDDTPMNLTVAQGLLKPTKVRVDTALSGKQCLEMIRRKSYDIIFMDQRMPEMDGVETLHTMKGMGADDNLCSKAPVIVLTANVVANAREEFIKEGFDDYLSKPIDAAKLEKMIKDYLPKDKVKVPSGTELSEDTPEHEDDFVKRLGEVSGIDAKAALANCMNADILKGAVHDFCVSLKSEPDKIEGLLADGNIRDYTIAVHALKSSARLIGALELSALAAELEKAGDDLDREKIDAKTPQLLEMYRGFYDKLMPLEAVDEEDDPDRQEIDAGGLAEAYSAIREAVEAFDYDTADDVVNMLKEYRIPDEESEKFTRVCDLVTRLDRDALMEEL